MKKTVLIFLVFFLAVTSPVFGASKKRRARPQIDRSASLVIEADTGLILHAHNSTARRHPASLTKMMTLYLTFQAIDEGLISLETKMRVSRFAAGQPATKIGLEVGQRLSVNDAIFSLVTISANDAAVVLAEEIAGNQKAFVDRMNRQAKALGMKNTYFRNPSGLPDRMQITTAQDMAILAHALIDHYPGFYPYFSRKEHRCAGRDMQTHNRLLETYDGMDGIKTGYTNASGFNLVSSAVRDGVRLIGIVFGGRSAEERNEFMARLLDDGFRKVQTDFVKRKLDRTRAAEQAADKVSFSSKIRSNDATGSLRNKTGFLAPPPGAEAKNMPFWGIQIGAYSDIESAERALYSTVRGANDLLKEAEQSLQKVTMTDGSVVYRVRFTSIEQKTARAICSHLIRNGQSCLVIAGE